MAAVVLVEERGSRDGNRQPESSGGAGVSAQLQSAQLLPTTGLARDKRSLVLPVVGVGTRS